jgi:transcriptional regulator with XRE-family HTH domain
MAPLERKIMRLRLGLKQGDIAARLGTSRGYISMLENPGYVTAPALDKAYEKLLSRLSEDERKQGGQVDG